MVTDQSPRVAIMMGSRSDLPVMEKAAAVLAEFGVPHEMRVLSAHRTPDALDAYVRAAVGGGVEVFICGAGMAAHLAGAVAARTTRPVIGVPLSATLNGLDALLSTVQMPPGIPVATVAVDGARNAAYLAVAILALGDPGLAERLRAFRERAGAEAERSGAMPTGAGAGPGVEHAPGARPAGGSSA